jgi:hypothetical protein
MLDSRAGTSKRSNLPQVGCGRWGYRAATRNGPWPVHRFSPPFSFPLTSFELVTPGSRTGLHSVFDLADWRDLTGKSV